MTLKQMVEMVRLEFPTLPREMIRFRLNTVMREFCLETRILGAAVVLNRTDDFLAEDDATGVVQYQLPADVYEVVRIDELVWDQYEVRNDVLHFIPPESDYDELTVYYTKVPSVMAADSDAPAFSEEFHEAVLAGGLWRLFIDAKNTQSSLAQYQLYRDHKKAAKQYVASLRFRNTNAFQGDDMGKIVAYGSQALVEGINTVSMGKTFSAISSYVLMLNGNGVMVEEYDPNSNNDQRTTSSFKVTSAADNPNFEYFAIGT